MLQHSFLDLARIGELALLVLMLVQYIKNYVPEKIIKPYLQIASGIAFSWMGMAYTAGIADILQMPIIKLTVDGILAGMASETGYGFLSYKPDSPAFSLPRKAPPIVASQ